MNYAAVFQFGDREYYMDHLSEEVSFGTHKKDSVPIPDTADHMLVLGGSRDPLAIRSQAPLLRMDSRLPANEIVTLSEDHRARIYVSQITGKSGKVLELPYNGLISCGRKSDNDIVLTFPVVSGKHFRLSCENGNVYAEDLNSTNHLYLNGQRIERAKLKSGDVLSIFTCRFLLKNGRLEFENMGSSLKLSESLLVEERHPGSVRTGGGQELIYHLSPRTREQLPAEDIILSAVPAKARSMGTKNGNWAYLIGSGAMLAASLATGTLSPGLLLARAAGMISPIANLKMYGKLSKEEQQQLEEYEKLRQESYRAYIDDQKARIQKTADLQRRILTEENGSPRSCLETVEELKWNLWERSFEDSDFLTTRLGIGRIPLCVKVKTRAETDGFKMEEDDELEELSARIIEETRYVDRAPVCISLRDFQTIGFIGETVAVYYLLRNMLAEISVQHSFQDVQIVGLFEENALANWGILRWLPHIWDSTGQVRYLAFDPKRRATVAAMLSEIIRTRREESRSDAGKKESRFRPHILVIAQNRQLLYHEDIYEDLTANDPALCMTTLILSDSRYELPQKCQVIVEVKEGGDCIVYEREKYDRRTYFTPDEPIHQKELESFFRRQAAIELETKGRTAQIPTSVTFLQGFRVRKAEELDVYTRWENSRPDQTLAAPIGIMEGGQVFSLDIKSGDQSHGPHGLLAGTTGSGKSELLQTWILSMAVNFHPYDVNFVIIDYKGGGMSDLMEPLPHVVGKITNIDRNITRALISLKSELRRRQELFARYGVNNIDKYQRAWKEGIAKERLPHLILVTDEFAELKKEEPEFMTELNSVATIGRSLGIHMLLATQRPAGVVTDQINSNSRFRICMKVQDVADSREMLKRADAARITQSGRAYVRVGEDEYFGLFQSFYSAAEYDEEDDGMIADNQVRIVEVTGIRVAVRRKKEKKKDAVDELTAVTDYINRVCKAHGIEKMAGPWLPELPRWMSLEEIPDGVAFDGSGWDRSRKGLAVPIGKYDIPQRQEQGILRIDFMETGHFGIFGIPGSGKTFLLKTILSSVGQYYPPQKVAVTVLDAASWSMSEYAGMPHVQEVILNQDEKKLEGFVGRMHREMETRKQAFLKHAVSSLEAYWETVSPELPAILIAVDQIGQFFEQSFALADLFAEIAAAGASFGVFLVFTANSTLGIPYKFLQLIKGGIALQMPDKGDYGSLVGPVSGVSLPNFPGRALLKGNPPVSFQAAVYLDEEEDRKRHDRLLELFAGMRKAWQEGFRRGEEAFRVPAAEAERETETQQAAGGSRPPFPDAAEAPAGVLTSAPGKGLYIGKDVRELDAVTFDPCETPLLVITSGEAALRSAAADSLLAQLERKADWQMFELDPENIGTMREDLERILNERKENFKLHVKEEDFDREAWLGGFSRICLAVRDFETTAQAMSPAERKSFRRIFTRSAELGVSVIAVISKESFTAEEPDLLTDAILGRGQILVLDGKPGEYVRKTVFSDADAYLTLDPGEAALICEDRVQFVNRGGI